MIDGQEFSTSEHYIQYCKAMYFGDTFVANAILNSSTPYEAKKLSYQINGINTGEWQDNGYELCYKGVYTKFEQNPDLLHMLKATGIKTVAEASNNHTWGTGVPLRDTRALNKSNWHSNGWLSDMLHTIRDSL